MRKSILLFVCFTALFGITSTIAQDLPVKHDEAGITVVIPDTRVFQTDGDNGKYFEAFTDIFGDGTMLIGANTFPEEEDGMNMKVAFANPVTGEVVEYWAFYTDAGDPWKGPFNEARQDGNPARVAADRRSGGTRYIVAMESTPMYYDEFNTGDRWYQDFDYDAQVGTVQIFNKGANGPEPITNAFDPIYQSGGPAGAQGGQQMRYGGDVRFLSNGNIVTVVEDRTQNVVSGGNGVVATIFNGETGEVIKAPFNAAGDDGNHSIWSNVAAFNGGFCVRAENVFTVFDNDGNMKYTFDQADFSTVAEQGRGDSVRIAAHIDCDYVFFAGKDEGGEMVISRFDAVATTDGADLQGVQEIYANEETFSFGSFDRADVACDGAGNVCIAFEDNSLTGVDQMVARVFNSEMEPVTPTFLAFQNSDGLSGDLLGVETKEPTVSMSNEYILISADGVLWNAEASDVTGIEQNCFIVLENPLKQDTSVREWDMF